MSAPSYDKWSWIRRFADRLVERHPTIHRTTASALGLAAYDFLWSVDPHDAADKQVVHPWTQSDGVP